MAMHNRGLSKLTEEIGELGQVVGKLQAYPSGVHPDGGPELHLRLEDEIADVYAALKFVERKLELSPTHITIRAARKFEQFLAWDNESP